VERWFAYLISAFDRALAPSAPPDDGILSTQRLREPSEPIAEAGRQANNQTARG